MPQFRACWTRASRWPGSVASCPWTARPCSASPEPARSRNCWARPPARASLLDTYKPYLHQRWNDGVTEAARLTKEITAQGYTGSEQTVRRYLHQFRGMITTPPPPPTAPKVRQVTGWLLRRPDDLDAEEHATLAEIRSRCPHMDALAQHVKGFAKMMTQRQGENLENWLSAVEADEQPDLHSFAIGIRRELRAVTAGLTLPHSSGKVEGNVNRLILWNLIYQVHPCLPCVTPTIGSRVTVAGTPISRGVAPAGVGTSTNRSSRWSSAVWPSSTAARSSSVSGMLASIRCRLSFASNSSPFDDAFGV